MALKPKKSAVITKELCVACGSCVPACPKAAIRIIGGVYAEVDKGLCVGCRKCFSICPASVIKMEVLA